MIIFTEIVIALGLIAFPKIHYFLKGVIRFHLVTGLVFGVSKDSTFFQAKIEGENKVFELHTYQFAIACLVVEMAYSSERPDIEIEE